MLQPLICRRPDHADRTRTPTVRHQLLALSGRILRHARGIALRLGAAGDRLLPAALTALRADSGNDCDGAQADRADTRKARQHLGVTPPEPGRHHAPTRTGLSQVLGSRVTRALRARCGWALERGHTLAGWTVTHLRRRARPAPRRSSSGRPVAGRRSSGDGRSTRWSPPAVATTPVVGVPRCRSSSSGDTRSNRPLRFRSRPRTRAGATSACSPGDGCSGRAHHMWQHSTDARTQRTGPA